MSRIYGTPAASAERYTDLYVKQGLGMRAIGAAIGVCKGKVKADLRRFGLSIRAPGPDPLALSEATMREMYVEQGMGLKTICRKMGVSNCKLAADMRRVGIDTRPKKDAVPVASAEVLRSLYWDKRLSADAIAPMFGVSNMKIKRDMKALGIERRRRGAQWIPSMSEESLRALHDTSMSAVAISEKTGIPYHLVLSDMKHYGIRPHRGLGGKPKTSLPQVRGETTTVPVVHGYFDTMTPDAAYILGLITADGSLGSEGRTVRIRLAAEDKPLLEAVQSRLGGALSWIAPMREGRQAQWCLAIHSARLWAALARRGLCPAKDNVLPKITAPAGFEEDFVRGLMDGDGSVSFVSGKRAPRVSFANRNRSLIAIVSDVWVAVGGETPGIREWGNNYCAIYAKSEASRKIAARLYLKPGALSLGRKRETAERFQEVRQAA